MQPAKVLIATDDERAARHLSESLQALGYRVIAVVNSAAPAFDRAAELRPDLVLLGIDMGGAMSGLQAAQAIRQQLALPVVLLCGRADDEQAARSGLPESFDLLFEPISQRELRSTLEMALLRHQSDQRRRLSEAALRAVSQGVIITDADGHIVTVNDAFVLMTGFERSEAIGRRGGFLLGPLSNRQEVDAIGQALSRGIEYFGELLNYRKDGSTFWNELTVTPVLDPQGQVLQYIGVLRDVTDRVQSQLQLKHSEQQLDLAVRGGGLGMWEWFVDSGRLNVNPRWLGMLGLDVHGPAPSHAMWRGLVHPDDLATLDRIRADVIDNPAGRDFEAEVRFRLADGREIWVHDQGSVVERDAEGRPLRVLGTHLDITERKRSEEALRSSEERFRAMVEWLPDGIVVHQGGVLLYVNPAAVRMFGAASEQELLSTPMIELVHPDFHGAVRQRLQRMAEIGEAVPLLEQKLQRLDGRTFDGEVQSTPISLSGKTAILAAVRDLTERHLADNQRRQLALAVGQSRAGIFITDDLARIEYANEAFLMASGLGLNELIGSTPEVFRPGVAEAMGLANVLHTLARGQRWRGEIHGQDRDGATRVDALSISPLRQQDGRISHFVAVQEDITEKTRLDEEISRHRHHLEELVASRTEELASARSLAEAASRAKSAFLANMSHEIRTPMNAIVGLTHSLRRSGMTPEQAERLDKIDLAGQHLLSIINDVLDLSKIDAGQLELESTDFLLGTVLGNVRDIVAESTRVKGIELRVENLGAPGWLRGDPTRLRQALLNYAGNAVKFTDEGSVTLRVEVLEESGRRVKLRYSVEDTGIGLPPNQAARLFQVFEQGDASTSRKFGGTGLGLSITRRLAELMGGEVGVEDRPGGGCLFWFTAWLQRGKGTAPAAGQDLGDAESRLRQHHAGARVLLAEDNEINRELVCEWLELVGIEVVVAGDGSEALACARASAYDLVLMDMQMPRLDGLQATRAIRQLPGWRDTPIVALTANAFEQDRRACRQAGMNDFLAKPVNLNALYGTMLHWLDDEAQAVSGTPAADDAGSAPAEAGAAPLAPTLLSHEELLTVIDRLIALLDAGDVSAISLHRQHAQSLRALLGRSSEDLKRQIEGFAFEAARELLLALHPGLTGT